MANEISYGFLRPQGERFSDVSFAVKCGSDVVEVTAEPDTRGLAELPSWGRGNDITVMAELSTVVDAVITDCDLSFDGTQLGALLRWHCPATSIRGFGDTTTLGGGTSRHSVTIPGYDVAGTVMVELAVVLLRNSAVNSNSVAPTQVGSVLWTQEVRILLEGIGSTVDTTPYDFAEAHEIDPGAMWRISLESAPEVHVTRAIRVFLNTSNRVTKTALANMESGNILTKETQMWQRFLDIDLRTHLVWAALGLSQQLDLTAFENDEESYGQTLCWLLRSYFPHENPETLLQKAATDPSSIATRVQNNYGDER